MGPSTVDPEGQLKSSSASFRIRVAAGSDDVCGLPPKVAGQVLVADESPSRWDHERCRAPGVPNRERAASRSSADSG